MATYKDDFSQEKKPFSLFPEGEREVRVTEMIASTSKAGNRMFTVSLEDIKTRATMQVWLIAEPKKRWMLKSLLTAVGVKGGEDGTYEYDTTDVIGKKVIAIISHVKEPWINREGVEVMTTKAKVSEFLQAPKDEAEVIWNE